MKVNGKGTLKISVMANRQNTFRDLRSHLYFVWKQKQERATDDDDGIPYVDTHVENDCFFIRFFKRGNPLASISKKIDRIEWL
jgi:hypothetical protein